MSQGGPLRLHLSESHMLPFPGRVAQGARLPLLVAGEWSQPVMPGIAILSQGCQARPSVMVPEKFWGWAPIRRKKGPKKDQREQTWGTVSVGKCQFPPGGSWESKTQLRSDSTSVTDQRATSQWDCQDLPTCEGHPDLLRVLVPWGHGAGFRKAHQVTTNLWQPQHAGLGA